MPYLVSLLTIVAATVVLVMLVTRLANRARRFTTTAQLVHADFADHTGLLTARIAALKVELDRRRHRRDSEDRDSEDRDSNSQGIGGRGDTHQTRSIGSREV